MPIPPPDPKLKVPPIPARSDARVPMLANSGAANSAIAHGVHHEPLLPRIQELENRFAVLEKRMVSLEVGPGSAWQNIAEENGRRGASAAPPEDLQPWLAAGVSKATWYRNRKKGAA